MVILRASYLKQNIGVMLIFFFKINVNLRQLLWFVVPLAVNGEFWRILAILKVLRLARVTRLRERILI